MSLTLPITAKIVYDKSSSDAPFVAYSAELDVSSCGKTEGEAKENLHEAIEITLEEASKNGTLIEFLESVGYFQSGKHLKSPKVSFEPFYFNVPDSLKSKMGWLV